MGGLSAVAPGGGDGGGFRRGPVGIRNGDGRRARPRAPPGRAGTRAPGVEAALAEAERRAKKPTKATEKKKVSAPPRASPPNACSATRGRRSTEPGRTLLPWRAIPRGEASARARARNARRLRRSRRTSTDGAAPNRRRPRRTPPSTSPAPPPPRLERTSPESLPEPEKLKRLNMASLKALLQVRGLPTDGMKYLLVARLDQNRGAPLNADSNAAAAAAKPRTWRGASATPAARPDCQCGVPCKEKTVRKEGPNKGKTFWACRRPKQAAPCGFFPVANGDARAGGRRAA